MVIKSHEAAHGRSSEVTLELNFTWLFWGLSAHNFRGG